MAVISVNIGVKAVPKQADKKANATQKWQNNLIDKNEIIRSKAEKKTVM